MRQAALIISWRGIGGVGVALKHKFHPPEKTPSQDQTSQIHCFLLVSSSGVTSFFWGGRTLPPQMPVTLATCKSKIRHLGEPTLKLMLKDSRVTLFHPDLISYTPEFTNMTLENPHVQ